MTEDNFKRHSLTPEVMATLKKTRKRQERFVKVPWRWVERLATARYTGVYPVALHILFRHWKGGGKPFALPNDLLAEMGVERRKKWRGLKELERLGLIAIERRPRKSPMITVLQKS